MENLAETNLNPESEQKIESIQKIVSSSAAENESRSFSRRAKPPKRGPGRPRKGGQPNRATLSRLGLDSDPLAPKTSVDASAPPIPGNPDPAAQALDIPPEMLRPVLQVPFNLLRARTGFDGFKLPDDVASECTPLLQQVLRQYMPATDSEHAPAVILATTLGTYLWSQLAAYNQWKAEQREHAREAVAKPASSGAASFPFEHIK